MYLNGEAGIEIRTFGISGGNRFIVRSHVTSKSPMRALAVRDEILAQ